MGGGIPSTATGSRRVSGVARGRVGCRDRGRKEGREAFKDGDWEAVPRHFLVCGEEVTEPSTGDSRRRCGKEGSEESLYDWR